MTIERKRKLLSDHLKETVLDLDKAIVALDYSYNKCCDIGKKTEYDLEEQESFEALTSRFARATDILTQKALKTLFALLQENVKTKIDAANLAEKLELVENADVLLNIRELRNQIAHEYTRQQLNTLFMDTLRYIPDLKIIVQNLEKYIENLIREKKFV